MKLLNILLNEVLDTTPEFNQEVSKLKDQGATFIGQGDYGKVFQLGDKIIKITSDSDEILHVKLLKGKKTNIELKLNSKVRMGSFLIGETNGEFYYTKGVANLSEKLPELHAKIQESLRDENRIKAKEKYVKNRSTPYCNQRNTPKI